MESNDTVSATSKDKLITKDTIIMTTANEKEGLKSNGKEKSEPCPEPSSPEPEKQLAKLKRFLSTIHKFAANSSPNLGQKVKALILSLVDGEVTVDDFFGELQSSTQFPLRPFVVPFLKQSLPLLRVELAESSKVVAESLVFSAAGSAFDGERNKSTESPSSDGFRPVNPLPGSNPGSRKGSFALPPMTQSPAASGFHAPAPVFLSVPKCSPLNPSRVDNSRTSSSSSYSKESPPLRTTESVEDKHRSQTFAAAMESRKRKASLESTPSHCDNLSSLAKHRMVSEGPDYPPLRHNNAFNVRSPPLAPPTSSGGLSPGALLGSLPTDVFRLMNSNGHSVERPQNGVNSTDWDLCSKEWKNIEQLFSSLFNTMDQLRYSLVLFQHKVRLSQMWNGQLKKQQNCEKLEEVKRRAEETIQSVKRQAVVELQKAVTSAEEKAFQMITGERTQMERAIQEVQRLLFLQEDKMENCWNCGRKATQRCSGCQLARYCGQFCQHKDWARHQASCRLADLPVSTEGDAATKLEAVVVSSTDSDSSPQLQLVSPQLEVKNEPRVPSPIVIDCSTSDCTVLPTSQPDRVNAKSV